MVNIGIIKENVFDGELDVILTGFNGTLDQAKNYYKSIEYTDKFEDIKYKVFENGNYIYKVLHWLLFKGYKINKIKHSHSSTYIISKNDSNLELSLGDLHNIGKIFNIYDIKENVKYIKGSFDHNLDFLKKYFENN